jgi:hypothetical protein
LKEAPGTVTMDRRLELTETTLGADERVALTGLAERLWGRARPSPPNGRAA